MEYLIAGITTTAFCFLIFGARQLLVQNVAVGERLPAGFGDREQKRIGRLLAKPGQCSARKGPSMAKG